MPSHSNPIRAGLIAAALLSLGAGSAAAYQTTGHSSPCFFTSQWQGWSSPSPDVLYLRVNNHDIYRVGLSGGSSNLRSPGMHLVSTQRGSSSICTALDLDLKLSDGHGYLEPLIARTLTKLTPEEVAAIPPKFLPGH